MSTSILAGRVLQRSALVVLGVLGFAIDRDAVAETISHTVYATVESSAIIPAGEHGEPYDPPIVVFNRGDRLQFDFSYSRISAEWINESLGDYVDTETTIETWIDFDLSIYNLSRHHGVSGFEGVYSTLPLTIVNHAPGQGADELIFRGGTGPYGRSGSNLIGVFHFINARGTVLSSAAVPTSLDILDFFGGSFQFEVPYAYGVGAGNFNAIATAAVPEPASLLSVFLGTLMLVAGRRVLARAGRSAQ